MLDPSPAPDLAGVAAELARLRTAMLEAADARRHLIDATHPAHRRSAANLVHYLALRRHDVRDLQARLTELGLSSLGRAEAHILATVEQVLALTAAPTGVGAPPRAADLDPAEGRRLLEVNATALLGPPAPRRRTRIMVTLPGDATSTPTLIDDMCAAGLDLARINCAHDDEAIWNDLADTVRKAARLGGERPRIAMDLGGPKLRTGPVRRGPQVVRVAPDRDPAGVVRRPAHVWLHHPASGDTFCSNTSPRISTPPGAVAVPVDDPAWLARRRVGEQLDLVDHRGARRRWAVVDVADDGVLAAATQTAYVSTGLSIECSSVGTGDAVAVAELPAVELALRVAVGDTVVVTGSLEPAEPTGPGERHRIGCTLPEVFSSARVGERVFFDDGKIAGTITDVSPDALSVRVTSARGSGSKLKADKGINLPDTDLHLDALTVKDLADLDVVARRADMVDVSFVRSPDDVRLVQDALAALGADDVGLVLKIENVQAFERLPELLLAAMRSRKVGVMIARGDLAVEIGFERLAEVQEEILWLCEAAHVPVIWATQVLDGLARTGRPSRAEITDAAMAERAECVMLNKGEHVVDAIRALDSILLRMQRHQHKKRSLLRRLHAWDGDDASCGEPSS